MDRFLVSRLDRTLLALAAMLLLGSCAAQTPEPRLPQAAAPTQTRNALIAAGLRPGTIEGPLGTLRYYEGGTGKTVVLLHGSGSQAGDWHSVVPAFVRRYHLLVPESPLLAAGWE